jgi:hypothetical protein
MSPRRATHFAAAIVEPLLEFDERKTEIEIERSRDAAHEVGKPIHAHECQRQQSARAVLAKEVWRRSSVCGEWR